MDMANKAEAEPVEKVKTIPITLRVTPELHARIVRACKELDRKYHGTIAYMLKEGLLKELDSAEAVMKSVSPISNSVKATWDDDENSGSVVEGF